MYRFFAIYKPYGMVSQFTKEGLKPTLADLSFNFPKDAYPVGRLDSDSEGLLLLTNDPSINNKLLDPKRDHQRVYLVQVDGQITDEACIKMQNGISIQLDGSDYLTQPCTVNLIDEPADLPPRNPPVRFRKNIPTSWIRVELTEGKNKQVRKMTAAVGYPTLRLIRRSIEEISIENMLPGVTKEFNKPEFYKKLHLLKSSY